MYEEDIKPISSGSTNYNNITVIFVGMVLEMENIRRSPLPSVTTDDKKQLQCPSIVLIKKRDIHMPFKVYLKLNINYFFLLLLL